MWTVIAAITALTMYRDGRHFNEIGDWLAGSFAPMAFLWFVLALFLQREELKIVMAEHRASKAALESQSRSLNRQVFMEYFTSYSETVLNSILEASIKADYIWKNSENSVDGPDYKHLNRNLSIAKNKSISDPDDLGVRMDQLMTRIRESSDLPPECQRYMVEAVIPHLIAVSAKAEELKSIAEEGAFQQAYMVTLAS